MTARGSVHRADRDGAVEGDEPAVMFHSQREQVNIGDGAVTGQRMFLDEGLIQQRNGIGPEDVMRVGAERLQVFDHVGGRGAHGWIDGIAQHAYATVQRLRTGGPAMFAVLCKPAMRGLMMDVRGVE